MPTPMEQCLRCWKRLDLPKAPRVVCPECGCVQPHLSTDVGEFFDCLNCAEPVDPPVSDGTAWKGLLNDPGLDGTHRVNDGLQLARRLLLDIAELGLPVGCAFLDPITPQYLADVVAWASIGAQTAHSQIHRQLASGLSMPVGIKNSTDGDIQAAVDAATAASAPHVFPGIDDDGRAAVFTTTGNPDCHIVLRGATTGPNYDQATVAGTRDRLAAASMPPRLLIDASHGNSQRDPTRQLEVTSELARRLAQSEPGIAGVMVESFLARGRQDLILGQPANLAYGQSITDACIGWDDTVAALTDLAHANTTRPANATTHI